MSTVVYFYRTYLRPFRTKLKRLTVSYGKTATLQYNLEIDVNSVDVYNVKKR